MFEKKVKTAPMEPLYKLVTITAYSAEAELNEAAFGGYRFLDWLDDKWERNGYSDGLGRRQAIYIKTP